MSNLRLAPDLPPAAEAEPRRRTRPAVARVLLGAAIARFRQEAGRYGSDEAEAVAAIALDCLAMTNAAFAAHHRYRMAMAALYPDRFRQPGQPVRYEQWADVLNAGRHLFNSPALDGLAGEWAFHLIDTDAAAHPQG